MKVDDRFTLYNLSVALGEIGELGRNVTSDYYYHHGGQEARRENHQAPGGDQRRRMNKGDAMYGSGPVDLMGDKPGGGGEREKQDTKVVPEVDIAKGDGEIMGGKGLRSKCLGGNKVSNEKYFRPRQTCWIPPST